MSTPKKVDLYQLESLLIDQDIHLVVTFHVIRNIPS